MAEDWIGCVGPGWAPYVKRVVEFVEKSEGKVIITQVKEKFGGLRIYFAVENDDKWKTWWNRMENELLVVAQTLCVSMQRFLDRLRIEKAYENQNNYFLSVI